MKFFQLFVYGTLKKGFRNHAKYCSTAINIELAYGWGRVYSLDEGYPVMEVPSQSILARGTDSPSSDVFLQKHQYFFESPTGDWDMVQGELILFKYPDKEIPPIDALEDFNPEGQKNLYERVLITVKTDNGFVNAWTYIMKGSRHLGKRVPLNKEGVIEWGYSAISNETLSYHS
ncbi:gamma-glutamylcyclotransferase family protein [Pelistega ratti]|uniref:gamma-glutamylcyclotransferase family protein n=1 Tax=Pelistega ratti TaxID=2652177 RepID=UPI0013596DF2|nr:gamma-glutamylcyclotransferase family protein [Pelistega ratti]